MGVNSAMFRIKIAGLVVGIDNQYEYVSRFCEHYKVSAEEEEFCVAVAQEEILKEQNQSAEKFPRPYCESLCLYRKICLKLIDYDAFLMHSAALEMDGEAYVFTAKSGTGKTTHIKLWMQEFGERVKVINGDKPVYRFKNDKLYACGTPWCGKEGFGNNMMSPVKVICFIEQGTKNQIRRLSVEEVIGRIFHQLLMPQNEEAMKHFFDLIDRMISTISCYVLQCNTSKEAAILAHQTMSMEVVE